MPNTDTHDTRPWLVIWSKPNAERKAQRWLGARGWVAYVPMLKDEIITRSGHVEELRPLFPRYLFVQEHADLDPVDVVYVPGVQDAVRRGDRSFARVADDVIKVLQSTEHEGVLQTEPPAPLAEGEAVEVELSYGGIGYSIVAEFSRMDGAKRAVVLHEMFGEKRESVVSLGRLQRVRADEGSSSTG